MLSVLKCYLKILVIPVSMFSQLCISANGIFKHLHQPPRSFRTLGQFFKISPFPTQKSHSAGGLGGWRGPIFLLWNPNISEPYDNPFSKYEREKETRDEREIKPSIMATSLAHWRTQSTRTNLNQNPNL